MRYALVAVIALLSACDNRSAAQPRPGEVEGAREHGMSNCPTAVPGARTTTHTIPGGMALEISASGLDARARIRELAALHASLDAPSGVPHTGRHGGPGTIGHCPVIHVDTNVSATEIPEGVRIRIVVADPSDEVAVDDLRAKITDRLTRK